MCDPVLVIIIIIIYTIFFTVKVTGYHIASAHTYEHLQVFLHCTAMYPLTARNTILYCFHLGEKPLTKSSIFRRESSRVCHKQ